jgi:hypothetical protein
MFHNRYKMIDNWLINNFGRKRLIAIFAVTFGIYWQNDRMKVWSREMDVSLSSRFFFCVRSKLDCRVSLCSYYYII